MKKYNNNYNTILKFSILVFNSLILLFINNNMRDCCASTKRAKKCKRKDGKLFSLPRKFTKKRCAHIKGFTMRSSCAPYKYC